jgi:hypothetical protein
MLIPGFEQYDYEYDAKTGIDTIKNLRTGNAIKFMKTKSRFDENTITGKRRLILYKAKLDGKLVSRGIIRGWCLLENGLDRHSEPFRNKSLIPINGNIEDDRVHNLKWVPRLWCTGHMHIEFF